MEGSSEPARVRVMAASPRGCVAHDAGRLYGVRVAESCEALAKQDGDTALDRTRPRQSRAANCNPIQSGVCATALHIIPPAPHVFTGNVVVAWQGGALWSARGGILRSLGEAGWRHRFGSNAAKAIACGQLQSNPKRCLRHRTPYNPACAARLYGQRGRGMAGRGLMECAWRNPAKPWRSRMETPL